MRTQSYRFCLIACVVAAFGAQARAGMIVYDDPTAKNFIVGIQGLVVTGTSNDGVYDVAFVRGSFNAVFGAGTVLSDLPFQTSADSLTVLSLINADLNSAAPDNLLVASSTPAFAGGDAYEIPFALTATNVGSRVGGYFGAPPWSHFGVLLTGAHPRTSASAVGLGGAYKWAVITPAQVAAVPEPASLTLLGAGVLSLAGAAWRRRKRIV